MTVSAKQVLTYAASQINTGESPANTNAYTRWYYGNNTAEPWCWIFLCYIFNHFGALDLIHGKHAYVPDFKSVFSSHGEYHTSSPKAGDLVAFDFNRSGEPEHIGIVEKVISSSTIQTIEGNTSNHVYRRTRSRSYVFGYATPKYAPETSGDWMTTIMRKLSTLKKGSTGYDVYTLQGLLNGRVNDAQTPVAITGTFDSATDKRVREEQSQHKIAVDGEVGPHTWAVLITGKDL